MGEEFQETFPITSVTEIYPNERNSSFSCHKRRHQISMCSIETNNFPFFMTQKTFKINRELNCDENVKPKRPHKVSALDL